MAGAMAFVLAPLAGEAQQAGKVWRIGVLGLRSRVLNANFDAFRQGLREFGYVDGQNFVIEYRSADGQPERFPGLATEMVRLKVDLILTRGTSAAVAAKNATRTIPIVMLGVAIQSALASSPASRARAGTLRGSAASPKNWRRSGSSCSKR